MDLKLGVHLLQSFSFPTSYWVNRLDNVGRFYSGPTEIVHLGECFKIIPTCGSPESGWTGTEFTWNWLVQFSHWIHMYWPLHMPFLWLYRDHRMPLLWQNWKKVARQHDPRVRHRFDLELLLDLKFEKVEIPRICSSGIKLRSDGWYIANPSARPRGTMVTLTNGSACSRNQPATAWPASWWAIFDFSCGLITFDFFSIPAITRSIACQRDNYMLWKHSYIISHIIWVNYIIWLKLRKMTDVIMNLRTS